ncbi:MAG: hypothetical protein C5B59_01120 [Bacteroidetes bacterium]|nr:MAG: hypothetical protein C5B59_01120 [Bacteroidota bacterium]
MTICAFIFAPDIVKTVPIFILNITFLRGFFNLYVLSGVPQGWSLTAEECFYFSAPFIFFLLKSIRLFIQPIFITLIGISLVSIFSRHYIYGFFENYTFMFGYTFFGRSLEFYIGIYLALRVKKLSRVEKKGFLLSLLGVLSIIFCILLALLTKKESDYNDDIHNPFEIAILLYLLPFAIGILFYGLLREKTYLSKLLGSGLFELLGKSSFVFYMIHVGFITIFLKKVFPIATPWGFISIFVCLNIISIILFKYVESPLNKLIRGLSKKNRRWAFQRA